MTEVDKRITLTDNDKLKSAEEQLNTLKGLSFKAVLDYEDLQKKYDKNHKAYSELQKLYDKSEKCVQNFEKLYEPVVEEYEKIKTDCELEKECRSRAEEFAAKAQRQNNKLKRQSQHLLTKLALMDIPLDEIDAIENETDAEVDASEKQLKDLQEKLSSVTLKFEKITHDYTLCLKCSTETSQKYNEEVDSHTKTKATLRYYETSIEDITNVSKKVLVEYENLKAECETEALLKQEASNFASKMMSERDAMKRQSSMLISTAAADERFMKAMLQIDELTSDLNHQESRFQNEISGLRTQLAGTCSLEDELERSRNDHETSLSVIDDLRRQRIADETSRLDLERRCRHLTNSLADAEELLKPPPPPPAPPLPPTGIFGELREILRRPGTKTNNNNNTSTKNKTRTLKDELFTSAIEEMMTRIKAGKTLRSIARSKSDITDSKSITKPTDNEKSAFKELQDSIIRIKRANTINDPRSLAKDSASELSEAYSRIRGNAPPFSETSAAATNLSQIVEERESLLGSPSTPIPPNMTFI